MAWRFRLPVILGFVVGGIVISPFTPGLQLSDVHTFEVFADVGVVLLMFSIGVEFSIPDLMRVIIRSGESRVVGGNGNRGCFQCDACRVLDFDIAERFPPTRHYEMAWTKARRRRNSRCITGSSR